MGLHKINPGDFSLQGEGVQGIPQPPSNMISHYKSIAAEECAVILLWDLGDGCPCPNEWIHTYIH